MCFSIAIHIRLEFLAPVFCNHQMSDEKDNFHALFVLRSLSKVKKSSIETAQDERWMTDGSLKEIQFWIPRSLLENQLLALYPYQKFDTKVVTDDSTTEKFALTEKILLGVCEWSTLCWKKWFWTQSFLSKRCSFRTKTNLPKKSHAIYLDFIVLHKQKAANLDFNAKSETNGYEIPRFWKSTCFRNILTFCIFRIVRN